MDGSLKYLFILAIGFGTITSRTVRYRIVTNENGEKELLGAHNETSYNPDIEIIAKDLNITTIGKEAQPTTLDDRMDASTDGIIDGSTTEEINHETYRLMNKWNSYTQNGWSKNNLIGNSTRLIIYDDGTKNNSKYIVKQGRAEKLADDDFSWSDPTENSKYDTPLTPVYPTDNNLYDTPLSPVHPIDNNSLALDHGVWDLLDRIYGCFQSSTKHGGTFECLKANFTSIFLSIFDRTLGTSRKSYHEKTLVHGKKLLKGALLPLLVLLVIKYLIALPVIAVGLITIKTFWLSLMSAGVAAFGNPWKKVIIPKRYENHERFEPWNNQNNVPWTGLDGQRKGEQLFM